MTTAVRNAAVALVIVSANFAETAAVTAVVAYALVSIFATLGCAFLFAALPGDGHSANREQPYPRDVLPVAETQFWPQLAQRWKAAQQKLKIGFITTMSGPQGVIGGFFSPENGIFGDLLTQFDVSPDSRTVVIPNRVSNTVNLYDIIDGIETVAEWEERVRGRDGAAQ